MADDAPLEPLEEVVAGAAPVTVADVVVANPHGLHLRPATEFARISQESGCRVCVRCGDAEGDGASVLELAMMAIGPGARLSIEVRGESSEETARLLVAAVAREFTG